MPANAKIKAFDTYIEITPYGVLKAPTVRSLEQEIAMWQDRGTSSISNSKSASSKESDLSYDPYESNDKGKRKQTLSDPPIATKQMSLDGLKAETRV